MATSNVSSTMASATEKAAERFGDAQVAEEQMLAGGRSRARPATLGMSLILPSVGGSGATLHGARDRCGPRFSLRPGTRPLAIRLRKTFCCRPRLPVGPLLRLNFEMIDSHSVLGTLIFVIGAEARRSHME